LDGKTKQIEAGRPVRFKDTGMVVAGPSVPDDGDMAKINAFALEPLTSDQVYTRKYVVAHSGIDRDGERFNPALLQDFARTLPGKGYFNNSGGHPGSGGGQKGPGQGLWYDAEVKQMSPDEFEAMTGNRPPLGPGESMIHALMGKMYTLKIPENDGMIANIKGGIHRHVSISFGAEGPVEVKSPGERRTLFNEWQSPGEAYEASSVWLGAQPGAVAVKAACIGCSHNHMEESKKGAEKMEIEEKDFNALKSKAEQGEKDGSELKTLKETLGIKDGVSVQDIKALAVDGKAYRESQVKEYVRLGRLAGKLSDDPEKLKAKEAVIASFPMDFLVDEIKSLRDEVRRTHPDQAELPGEELKDKLTNGKPGEGSKSLETRAGNDWLE
jgi:hypothetical protein